MKTISLPNIMIGMIIMMVVTLFPFWSYASPPTQTPGTDISSQEMMVQKLEQGTNGEVRISYHNETGKVRFIGTSPRHPIGGVSASGVNAAPEQAARSFLDDYGLLFGLNDQRTELTVMKEQILMDDRAFIRFQQNYRGIPVFGGELIVQVDKYRNVIAANGEVLPDLMLNIVPSIGAQAARQTALETIALLHSVGIADLTTTEPELWIYNPALLDAPGVRIDHLVWRMNVTPQNEVLPINELVLVDAHSRGIVLHFNQMDPGLP